jgi:ABC-2 type transport system permease protein
MFITPLSLSEYMIAQIISSFIKSMVIFGSICIMYSFVFEFNILRIGYINFVFYLLNLLIFSWAIGMILLGVIFKWGTKIQALAWGAIFLFQPLAAVFFPVSVLPPAIQKIALAIPVTYVFEGARANISNPTVNWQPIGMAFFLNFIYVIISVLIFRYLHNKSKETGQFARNES